jgi:hypothetical protein
MVLESKELTVHSDAYISMAQLTSKTATTAIF